MLIPFSSSRSLVPGIERWATFTRQRAISSARFAVRNSCITNHHSLYASPVRDGLPDRHVACRCGESPGVARVRDVGWRSHGRAVVPARILLARRDAESIAAHSLGQQQRGVGAVEQVCPRPVTRDGGKRANPMLIVTG